MKHLIRLSIIFFLYAGCTHKKKTANYNGIWKSIGHGELLHIKGEGTYAFYDITSISCVPRGTGNIKQIAPSLRFEADTLSLQIGAITTRYIRASGLPIRCSNPVTQVKAQDPLYNFEVFMETVKEHYAFLELNELDWDELYREQKAKLTQHSNKADLFVVLEDTYKKSNDNHANLEASDEVYDLVERLYPEAKEPADTVPALGDFHVAHTVAKHHLEEDMTKDSWLVHWGKIKDDMGYIQVLAMNTFADLTPLTVYEEGWHEAWVRARDTLFEDSYLKKEIEGVRNTMNRVMKDLADMDAIIIDVRFNGGGHDVVSFEILSRFIQDEKHIANHKFSYDGRHTPTDSIYNNVSENPFLKPVYLLTSPQTGSAAEVFCLASMAVPHVQRIGSATMGALSTTLDKILPNGWEFAVSNEVYMDTDGQCYENIGIPVHHELHYLKDRQPFFRSVINDLQKDKQSILEAIEAIDRN